MGEEWTAEQWLQWLKRGPSDPVPSYRGLNDCADALAKAIVDKQATLDALRQEGRRHDK